MINEAIKILGIAQSRIAELNDCSPFSEEASTLMFAIVCGTLHINYFGSYHDEDDDFTEFINAITHTDVAPLISKLIIEGQDEGANGTRELNLLSLLKQKPSFGNLHRLIIKGTELHHHNRTIIGECYEEDGQISRLFCLCPNLLRLVVPSAPNHAFFERDEHPLRMLEVQAGYDTQNFISNFSRSKCFPSLTSFDYTDYSETYREDYADHQTPFEVYLKLFESSAFRNVKGVILRNTICTENDFKKLLAINPNRGIKFINTQANHIYP